MESHDSIRVGTQHTLPTLFSILFTSFIISAKEKKAQEELNRQKELDDNFTELSNQVRLSI